MNLPPVRGACTTTPATGVALNTTFNFACDDYTDAPGDEPFAYAFELVRARDTSVIRPNRHSVYL